jgi:hypothetical protein
MCNLTQCRLLVAAGGLLLAGAAWSCAARGKVEKAQGGRGTTPEASARLAEGSAAEAGRLKSGAKASRPAADLDVPRLWFASLSRAEHEARDEAPSTSDLMIEVLGVIEEHGAVYLLIDDMRCEEWPATIEGDHISLVRETYLPLYSRVEGREPRLRESRTIGVSPEGLVSGSDSKSQWLHVAPPSRRGIIDGGLLCGGPTPHIARVRRGVHYEIGGADLYFTRRACEEALAPAAQERVLIARCGDRRPAREVAR